MSAKGPSRRTVAIGGGVAGTLGIAALALTAPRLFGRHYRASPYDDLLAQLVDREAAVKVGQAALQQTPQPAQAPLARNLRGRLERRTLAQVTDSDLAQGQMLQAGGWVLPETLVLLCVLAARQG